MRKKKPRQTHRTVSPVTQADSVTGIVTGRWEIDTIGDLATGTPGGGRFYRSGFGSDKDLRFSGNTLYRDNDKSKTYSSGDTLLGESRTIVETTGKTGTFAQQAIGSSSFDFFADALGGAIAGTAIFNVSPW